MSRVVEWKEKVDILVNNAGVYPPGLFLTVTEEQWIDVVDTNLNGPFRFSQACARIMSQQRLGSDHQHPVAVGACSGSPW